MLTEKRRHDEIRNLYVEQLAYIWMEDSTTETTYASVEEKVASFAEGDLEHATEILSALWEVANRDGDIKAPADTPPAVSPFFSPASCGNTQFTSPARGFHGFHSAHEPCPLDRGEDRAYQVNSQRGVL
jgi:hypothetical protein